MNILPLHPLLKARLTPPAVPPSRRVAHLGASAALYAASTKRIRYRVLLVWRDESTPSGKREEVVKFDRPDRLLDFLRRITTTPDRPLLSARLQAKPTPKWEDVTPGFVAYRADQRTRSGGAR